MEVDELKVFFRDLGIPSRAETFQAYYNDKGYGVPNICMRDALIERGIGCLYSTCLVYVKDRPVLLFYPKNGCRVNLVDSFGKRSGVYGCNIPLFCIDDEIHFFIRGNSVHDIQKRETVNLGIVLNHGTRNLEVLVDDDFRAFIESRFLPVNTNHFDQRTALIDRLCISLQKYCFRFYQKGSKFFDWRLVASDLYNAIVKLNS